MPKLNSNKTVILVLLIIGTVFIVGSTRALAGGLSIQPIKQEIQLPPGQSVPRSLSVFNTSNHPEQVKVFAKTFGVTDENYDYDFGVPPDISTWVQFDKPQVTIGPGAQHTFNYALAIPNDAEPGGHYLAIFATVTNASQTDSKSTITEQAGSLIYLTVNGQVSMLGKLLNYGLPKISFNNSLPWDARIQNTGNNHFNSTIQTDISHWFGRKINSSSETHLILPGTIRALSGQYKAGHWPDLYKIKVKVSLGQNPAAQRTIWMLYLPPFYSFMIIVILAVIGLEVSIIIKKRRRKKTT